MEKRVGKVVFVVVGAWLFGYLGVDRFMRGQIGLGILKILEPTGIWCLVDLIVALTKLSKYDKEFVFNNGKWA